MPRTIIDMRCLQDPNYAVRGIGSHARCMVMQAPEPFTGIIDPKMPPLPPELAARAETLSPHAYLPDLPAGSVFLNPSPMSPNQNFIGRLLLNPHITKAALVYDFIPHDDPENYLTDPKNRLDYYASMAWLRRYNQFFPISEATAARLRLLYGPVSALVTGVALPPWTMGASPKPPLHILMVVGDDYRKNPEVMLRAHAGSRVLRDIPLVIAGHYSLATQGRLSEISPALFPGRLRDDEMRALYEQALCVVTPSRAEGFSMPVIEAMACGSPAIVSDIPAHRALVRDASLRFGPDDVAGLIAILEALVNAPGRREAVIASQSQSWRGFTPQAVAGTVWRALTPAAPIMLRRAKPRIAMLTPLPPIRSGVAHYSAALARELARLVDLTMVSGPLVRPHPHLAHYDRTVSVIGNSLLHGEIYDLALQWGSAAICHDSRLINLAARDGLAPAAALATQECGRLVRPDEVARWDGDESAREASFFGPLARAARPLIFHSQACAKLTEARFGVRAKHLPFAIYRPFAQPAGAAARLAARRALGLAPDEVIIASFGFIHPVKAFSAARHGFARLKGEARLIFVGESLCDDSVFRDIAISLGISPRVTFVKRFLDEADYRHHLLAANGALQLRASGSGNISGALQDCIAAGLPAVANEDLADNLAAPGYVKRVSDALNPEDIAAALGEMLAEDAGTQAERDAYCAAHSMANYAKGLLEILAV